MTSSRTRVRLGRPGYKRSLSMVWIRVALAFVGIVGLAAPAHAQSPLLRDEAKRHFEQGLRLYNIQSYDEAIVEFKVGYQIDPRPEFLYALGQAQRMNHQCGAAVVSYEAFLRTTPAPRQEAAAKDQIEACRVELASEIAAPVKPDAAPPVPRAAAPEPALVSVAAPASAAPASPEMVRATLKPADAPAEQAAAPVYGRWWFWALIGGGVAAGVAIAASAGAFTRTMEPSCGPPRYCSSPPTAP